jgi:hypothetical protein
MPPNATINPLTEQVEMVFRLCEARKLTRREIARQLVVSSTMLPKVSRKSWAALHAWAGHSTRS